MVCPFPVPSYCRLLFGLPDNGRWNGGTRVCKASFRVGIGEYVPVDGFDDARPSGIQMVQ